MQLVPMELVTPRPVGQVLVSPRSVSSCGTSRLGQGTIPWRAWMERPPVSLFCQSCALSFALAMCRRAGLSSRRACTKRVARAAATAEHEDAVSIVRQAAAGADAGISGKEVEAALLQLEAIGPQGDMPADSVAGLYDLVYSSALVNVPFVSGYMPTKEELLFDFDDGRMQLSVNTLPFLPAFEVIGENCSYDEASKVIKYTIKGKTKVSEWQVLYADGSVLAARSNVTGLNIARRI
mmetsp:Transcript_25770/g.47100  ORF Transcript_25770/g.47100 Transcript_25770/m.47100 type:complete len:237 (+) Transcript_25770:38-748(+)